MEETTPKTTNEKIKTIYEDKSGFGSMAQTVKYVKRHYPEVSKVDIERWYKSNVERNVVQRSGYNSYVAKKPLE